MYKHIFVIFIGRNDIHCVNLKKSKTESTASDLLTVDEYNQTPLKPL